MSDSSERLATERRGGVQYLILNRPERRNALDGAMIAALGAALARAAADPEVRVVALRGAGPDFCAGADLDSIRAMRDAGAMDNLADADRLGELLIAIRRLRRPVVALVHGRALAGGCGLATACDLVLAADDATFGYPEVHLGFVPAMVAAILRRNVGEKRAFELITRGERIPAAEAVGIGLVNRVFPANSFEAQCDGYLGELASASASAVELCKRLLYLQDGLAFEAAIRAGAEVNALARATPDAQAGIARFLERA